jgi:VanZ family protein
MKALIYASVISVAFGIIIEVLQEILTETRSADLLDVLANSLGVLIAACSLLLKKQKLS